MKVIGLCGRSGSGKGYVCERLEALGVPCVDTDAVYRRLTSPAKKRRALVSELCRAFGKQVVAPDNSLDRSALGEIVFADAAALASLDRIAHKYILAEVRRILARYEKNGVAIACVDAPLLFESGFDAECDLTVCVTASEETRLRRIMRRDGIDEQAARRRLASQKSDDELRSLCDAVIVNDGDDAALDKSIAALISSLSDEDLPNDIVISQPPTEAHDSGKKDFPAERPEP